MSNNTTNGKSKFVIAAGLMIMSLTMACNSALSPILAEVGKSFPEASDASIQIVLTMINLLTVPMMLLEPFLERVMTKRNVAILGTFLMLIGGLLPQVMNTQLWMLYVVSAVLGIGLSLVVVTSSSLISDYFTGIDKSRVMGFQSIFVSIGGTIIAKGSGAFTASWGWQKGYLVFLIAVPIIIAIFCMVPKGEIPERTATESSHSAINGSMIYFGFLCLITGIFVATFNTNLAMYLDRNGIGDASAAGTAGAIMQFVGIIGGLILGSVVKTFKRFTIGASIILMALGTAVVGFTTSFPLICVGAFLMGIGFAIRNPGAVTFSANMVSASQASLAIAIVSATYNLGNFLSAYIINPLAGMFSQDIGMRFIVSAVALLIIGVIACIKAPTTNQQALDSQN